MRTLIRKKRILAATSSVSKSAAYQAKVIADGASEYWPLDDTLGTTVRNLASSKVGTISGGVTLNQPGVGGAMAMTFDGVTGRIVTENVSLLTPFTIELWVRRNSTTSHQVIVCYTWGAGDSLAIFQIPGAVYVYNSPPSGSPTVNVPYDTTWHHVVLVSAAGVAAKVFINGTARAVDDPTPINFTAGVAKPFEIGFDPNWTHFNGSLQDVAIYPRALTPAEISAHYALRS